VPTTIDGDELQMPIGPFLATGTIAEWRQLLDRERADALPLSQAPAIGARSWEGDRIPFPVTNTD